MIETTPLITNILAMKKLFSFGCISALLFLGSILSAHSYVSATEIVCESGGCTTTLNTTDEGWTMDIDCGDDGSWEGSGSSGPWVGRLCGVSINGGGAELQ